MNPEGFARVYGKIDADIKREGWAAVGVYPTEQDPGSPFCYSVGLTELDHPEMIIFGMAIGQMHEILSDAYHAVKGGYRFVDGEKTDRLCEAPYRFAMVGVPGDGHPANIALGRYGEIVLLQAVWPDTGHHYPWDEEWEFDEDLQPILRLSPVPNNLDLL